MKLFSVLQCKVIGRVLAWCWIGQVEASNPRDAIRKARHRWPRLGLLMKVEPASIPVAA